MHYWSRNFQLKMLIWHFIGSFASAFGGLVLRVPHFVQPCLVLNSLQPYDTTGYIDILSPLLELYDTTRHIVILGPSLQLNGTTGLIAIIRPQSIAIIRYYMAHIDILGPSLQLYDSRRHIASLVLHCSYTVPQDILTLLVYHCIYMYSTTGHIPTSLPTGPLAHNHLPVVSIFIEDLGIFIGHIHNWNICFWIISIHLKELLIQMSFFYH